MSSPNSFFCYVFSSSAPPLLFLIPSFFPVAQFFSSTVLCQILTSEFKRKTYHLLSVFLSLLFCFIFITFSFLSFSFLLVFSVVSPLTPPFFPSSFLSPRLLSPPRSPPWLAMSHQRKFSLALPGSLPSQLSVARLPAWLAPWMLSLW